MTTEPMCCNTPMVHNSWTEEYECADAYFQLLDDGVLGDVAQRSNTDAMNDYQRGRYEHWLASRIPDFVSHYASRRDPSVHVEAIQLTDAADWEAIARWCGGELRNHEMADSGEYATTLRIPGTPHPPRFVSAGEGDWVVKTLDDLAMVLIWRPTEFVARYSALATDSDSTSPRS